MGRGACQIYADFGAHGWVAASASLAALHYINLVGASNKLIILLRLV